jgi:hypothetical protein
MWLPGVNVCYWIDALLPAYTRGSCVITKFHGGPVDDYVRECLEPRGGFAGDGWICTSGDALRYALTENWLLPWTEIYLFTERLTAFARPPKLSDDAWHLDMQEGPEEALVEYLDSVGASGYAKDMYVSPWDGSAFVFRGSPVPPETMEAVLVSRFRAFFDGWEGPMPDLAVGGFEKG